MTDTVLVTHSGMQRVIRHANAGDAEALIRAVDTVARGGPWFLRGSFSRSVEEERQYLEGLNPENSAYLVATVDGAIVGWLTINRGRAEYTRHTAEIGIGVVEPFRGIGIGTALLQSAIDWARSRQIEKVCLGVRATNERAIYVYRRLGFVEEGRRPRHVKSPEGYDDEILMAVFV